MRSSRPAYFNETIKQQIRSNYMAGEQMDKRTRETEEEKRVFRELHEINIKIRKLESEIERL